MKILGIVGFFSAGEVLGDKNIMRQAERAGERERAKI